MARMRWCSSLCTAMVVVVSHVVVVVLAVKHGADAFPKEGFLYSPVFSQLCAGVSQQPGSPPGEKVEQWNCPTNDKIQRHLLFTFEKVGARAYRIRPECNRRCLGIQDKSSGKGAAVVTQPCVDEMYQLWRVTKEGGIPLTSADETKSPGNRRADANYFQIRATHTNQCLSVSGNSKETGAKLVQFTCKAAGMNLDQLWDIQAELGYNSPVSNVPGRMGIWSEVIELPLVAAAATNLPDGKILSWAADSKSAFSGGSVRQTAASIYNPDTTLSSDMTIADTQHDMFGAGASVLFDGRVLITGGANAGRTTFYDPRTNIWSVGPELNRPRGHHGQTVLADGSVFMLGGSAHGDIGGKYGEVWDPYANVWTGRTNIRADGDVVTDDFRGLFRADNHMWLYLAPNGLIFHAGPSRHMHWMDVWSSPQGAILPAGQRSSTDRMNGCSVMYDIGKILAIGGAAFYDSADATTEAFIIDINNGTSANVTQTGSLHFPRVMCNAVVLPNGHVLAIGGQSHSVTFSDALAQYRAELWKPETGEWELLENAAVPRNYHSVALLMKNGKVWSAGGGLCGGCKANHLDAQVFTPPYLVNARTGMPKVQPMILYAPTVIRAGSVFAVKMDSDAVHSFALCRFGAVSHSQDNDTRRIPLTVVSQSGSNTTLSVPSSTYISLTGSYHLFGMNPDGVPSVGHVLHLHPRADDEPTPHPSVVPTEQPSVVPTEQPSVVPTEKPVLPAFSRSSIYRINAVGPSGTVNGMVWDRDDNYRSGRCKKGKSGKTSMLGVPLEAQFLYKKERRGPCTFTMPVDPGSYRVVMHFAELHHRNQQVGARLFDISVQNDQVTLDHVDIFAAVGGDTVYHVMANVKVSAGEDLIVKTMKGARKNPKIAALEVIPLPDQDIVPSITTNVFRFGPPTSAPTL